MTAAERQAQLDDLWERFDRARRAGMLDAAFKLMERYKAVYRTEPSDEVQRPA